MSILDDLEKEVYLISVRKRAIAAGALTMEGYNSIVQANTNAGAVNWTGILTAIQELVTELPAILTLITQLLPLFGG